VHDHTAHCTIEASWQIVRAQPATQMESDAAMLALLACPVGAIGAARAPSREQRDAFPLHVDGSVCYCGYNAEASFGANGYLVVHPGGNEALGGLRYVFLTHRDDCADAPRYAARFGAQRIAGEAPARIADDFTIIPTSGHTRGHCVPLHNEYLFTGDHLDYDPDTGRLAAWRNVCWYSWPEQLRSVAKLRAYDFSWVLPGHGRRVHQSPAR
jgi:glyoxylase-like metal-dependent hydrolase (beta-lactamase superfamily II)